ncbi:uncharacterized protein BKA78DRAFT_316702 [Phyllosticta capitalensis]|uniref:uncharacterized protein n=1 Tax=Phyllosticta capitalensis TaxID=121624 RepID=UPI00312E662B
MKYDDCPFGRRTSKSPALFCLFCGGRARPQLFLQFLALVLMSAQFVGVLDVFIVR